MLVGRSFLDWCQEDYDDDEIFLGFNFDKEFELFQRHCQTTVLLRSTTREVGNRSLLMIVKKLVTMEPAYGRPFMLQTTTLMMKIQSKTMAMDIVQKTSPANNVLETVIKTMNVLVT